MAEDLSDWFADALQNWQVYLALGPAGDAEAALPGGNALVVQPAPPGENGLAQAAPQGDAASLNTPPICEVEFEAIDWQPSSPWRNILDTLGEEKGGDWQEDEFCLDGLLSPWTDEEDQEALEDARGCDILDACLLPLSPQSQDDLLELGIMPEVDRLDWEAESGLVLEPCATGGPSTSMACATGGPSTSTAPIQSDTTTTITGKIYFYNPIISMRNILN